MKNKNKPGSDYSFGIFAAAAVFTVLTVFSGSLLRLPDSGYAKGLAVMSARLMSIGSQLKNTQEQDENAREEPQRAPVIREKTARRLIALSGFGAWDIEAAPDETEPDDDETEEAADEDGNFKLEYPESLGESGGKIIRKTYTYRPSATYLELPGGGMLRNCTDIDPEYLLEQAQRKPDFSSDENGPLVLIMHTHTTESYEPTERDRYDKDFSSRTTDLEKSVAKVGEMIANELEKEGIGVIHDVTVHDYPRYTGAYDRSAETVRGYLEKYPSIKIVIDVHRDAIEEDGVRYAPAVEIDGRSAAQVMIISGCKNVPQYRYNLRIAARLQSQMESDYPGLTRPILFDERNYNQEYTHGSFLIEMGSSANSLAEALYSGELVGKSLAKTIKALD